jgi:PST family polysaccharide transporter
MAATFIFSGLTVQHQALLHRKMAFKRLAIIDVVANFLGIAAAISIAFVTRSYWALIAMPVVSIFANAIGVWIATGWLPGRPQGGIGILPMVKFGGDLTAASVFDYFRENTATLVIGLVYGATSLGLFDRSYKLLVMPIHQLLPPMSSVAIPTLSRVQSDADRFRRIVSKIMALTVAATLPVTAISIICAHEIIMIVFGNQWIRAVPIFACLAVLGVSQVASAVAIWSLKTSGASRILLKFSICNALITVASILLSVKFGLLVVAITFSLVGLIIRTPLLFYFTVSNTPVRMVDVFRAVGRPVFAAICLILSGLGLRGFLAEYIHLEIMRLIIVTVLTGAVWFVVVRWTPVLRDAIDLILTTLFPAKFNYCSANNSGAGSVQ